MSHAFSLDELANNAQETVNVKLPADVAAMLEKQAKALRKPVAVMMREWLEDRADVREAERRLKDIKAGKSKAIAWGEARRRLVESA